MIKSTDYPALHLAISALGEGECATLSRLANASALLFEAMDGINWVGFYLWRGDRLILGPFQGKVACTEILPTRGVCGASVRTKSTVVVPDVHAFAGHIACDAASRSEIVVPLLCGDRLLGVLDVDSPIPSRFSEEDRAGLEEAVRILLCDLARDPDFLEEGRL